MSLVQTLFLVFTAVLIRLLFPEKNRSWAILGLSTIAIYWLQPTLPIRQLDFWIPTASLGLVFLTWGMNADAKALRDTENLTTAGFAFSIILLLSMTRYISLDGILTASRPPHMINIIISLAVILVMTGVLIRYIKNKRRLIIFGILIILCIFLIMKTPALSVLFSVQLRTLFSQNPALAKKTDLGWLGFSYLAFRIIHTMVDSLQGRLKAIKLREYLIFTLFYPAFLAGPLDRLQRFRNDLENFAPIRKAETEKQLIRLVQGLFQKFIIADTLAVFAISNTNVSQVTSSGWMWVMTIAYSLQIFFDFAGYTHIAIAAGGFLGINLPENFDRPYLQPNLTQFWNRWHMTLTQWFRSYFFNPLTRYLRRKEKMPVPVIIFFTQMSTMIVIGLWHGITLNFFVWGIWHGLGLFVHNRWVNTFGYRMRSLTDQHKLLRTLMHGSSILLTFTYVSIGWLWFALSEIDQAWLTIMKLFNIG